MGKDGQLEILGRSYSHTLGSFWLPSVTTPSDSAVSTIAVKFELYELYF